VRKIVAGAVVAACLSLVMSRATIGGIDAWKIVLAGVGFLIFAAGGRARK
jgi:hypothetical protein